MNIKNITVRLYPTKKQIKMFEKCVQYRNHCYNYGIDFVNSYYKETGKFTTFISIHKKFKEDNGNKGFEECSSKIPSYVFKDVIQAYKNFFDGRKNYPKYKNEKSIKSFPHRNDFLSIRDKHLRLEKIGWVRMKDNGRLPRGTKYKNNLKLYNCRIIYDKSGNFWYANIGIEYEIKPNKDLNKDLIIGIDLGIKDFAILSNGRVFENINKQQKILKLEKTLNKNTGIIINKFENNKGLYSNNINKLENINKTIHYKLKCIRKDYIYKTVNEIINYKPYKIVIENLNIINLVKKSNHFKGDFFNQYIGVFKKVLTNKCKEYGIELVVANKYYPSTQRCSNCGNIKKDNERLTINDRVYKCDKCGLEMDRDLNASINLRDYKDN